MSKKIILFVASEFASGMRPFAATIINTLAACDDFEVHCLCVNAGRQTYKGMINDTAHPVYVEYPQGKVQKMFAKIWPMEMIKTLRGIRDTLKPDIVHFLTLDYTFANYVRFHRSSDFYYTVHDLHPHEMERKNFADRMIDKYIKWGGQKMREKIKHLTTSSLTQVSELKTVYPDKIIGFTHFPTLVTEKIAKGKMSVKELEGVDNYVLFFGCVDKYKGVDLLIEAFDQIEKKENCKLVIAGVGTLTDKDCTNENIIRINRFIDDEEVGELFRKAVLVVYPYRSATMSGVLSLAFYFHKKVLLSDIPYFKDNACELVTFFKNGDVEDMAKKMKHLMVDNNSIVHENCYEQLYSSKVMLRDYMEFYEKQ